MHFARLLTLTGLVFGGLILTGIVGIIIKIIPALSDPDRLKDIMSTGLLYSGGETRLLLIAQHTLGFILPAYIFARIYFKNSKSDLLIVPQTPQTSLTRGFDLHVAPGFALTCLGILFLIASYPLVNLSFMVNEVFPMPDWAISMEQQARATMELIIAMPTPWIFLLNLLIIGILPGIGEELIFRGILQKEMGGLLRSPIAAIWISAFIFSAIHFQLEGLLPRMVLGVVLGYLYYWTKNLWVPILAHAFNNGVQVMLIYFTGMDVSEVEEQSSRLEVWMIPLSVGVMFGLYHLVVKQTRIGKNS